MKIYDIVWETDGVDPGELGLPSEVELSRDEANLGDHDEISDWLSDKFGWLVSGFNCEPNAVASPSI